MGATLSLPDPLMQVKAEGEECGNVGGGAYLLVFPTEFALN